MSLLTGQPPQEVQLRPADVGMAFHHHFIDPGREQQEGALDTNTVGGSAANGEIGIIAALARADDCALKLLDTLAVTFFDANVYAHLITGFQFGDFLILGRIEVFVQVNHDSFSS